MDKSVTVKIPANTVAMNVTVNSVVTTTGVRITIDLASETPSCTPDPQVGDIVAVRVESEWMLNDPSFIEQDESTDEEADPKVAVVSGRAIVVRVIDARMLEIAWMYSDQDPNFEPPRDMKRRRRNNNRSSFDPSVTYYASTHCDEVLAEVCEVVDPDAISIYDGGIYQSDAREFFGTFDPVRKLCETHRHINMLMSGDGMSRAEAIDTVLHARHGIFSSVRRVTASIGVLATELASDQFPSFDVIRSALPVLGMPAWK